MKEELLKKLSSEDKSEVRDAIELLAQYEEPDVIRAIVETTVAKKSKAVLEAAKNTLMKFSKEPKTLCEEVIKLFEYPEPKLRQSAIDILADKGNVCIPTIREKLLEHEDYNMRKFALDILANIGTEEALKELSKLISDENPNVSMSALEYLRNFSNLKDKVVAILIEIIPQIRDLYGLTTLASTIIYGEFKDDRLVKPLLEKLKELSDPNQKHWIYKTLVFLGYKDIRDEALENARSIGMEADIQKDIEIFGLEG